jgi:hypothetical protein
MLENGSWDPGIEVLARKLRTFPFEWAIGGPCTKIITRVTIFQSGLAKVWILAIFLGKILK